MENKNKQKQKTNLKKYWKKKNALEKWEAKKIFFKLERY